MTADAPIYLDHNATTPILPEVVDAMLPYLREHFGNPSSSHVYGRRAHQAVARARVQVAALLGCDDDEVIFTSGGTEANNLAIRGVAEARPERRHIVTSVIEHPATEEPCEWLERHGQPVTRIGVDADGRARLEEARAAIGAGTALVTVMHSNNETGVLQPIGELTGLAHERGAIMHTDAAQSVGKVPVDVRDLGVDLLIGGRPQAVRAEGDRGAVRPARHAAPSVHPWRRPRTRPATGYGERAVHRGARGRM